jgi:hypothetical protein
MTGGAQSVTIDGLTITAKYPGIIPYPQKIEIERIADGIRYRYIDPPSGWIELKKAGEWRED